MSRADVSQTPAPALQPLLGKIRLRQVLDWKILGGSVFCGVLLASAGSCFAQLDKPATPASAANAGKASTVAKPATSKAALAASKPSWTDLTPMQQQTLKPLAASWASLSEAQKRKWLQVSKNYASLPAAGQETMHSRMSEWAALSSQQRAEARLNFGKTKELSKQLSPEEKKAKWETYQALSPEEKQKLAARASRPAGAAPALKPVAPQKLAVVPLHSVKPEVSPVPRQDAPPAAAPVTRPAEDPTHGSTTAGSN
jgi:Protein of unknown function (DUF3106)